MMKKPRAAAIAALGLGVALAASACAGGASSGNSGGGSSSGGNVTLTFWTNATPGPGLTFFQNAVKSFDAAHPGVTIKMQNIQNEDYDGKLQTALASNTAPDIFFQRGGGKMQAMDNAGQLQELNLSAADKTNIGAGAPVDSINGTVYGIPPVAGGAKDAWPAPHWYYNFALRECSQATMNTAGSTLKFTDPCWTKAANDLAAFLKVNPFQPGFLTPA